MKKTLLVLLLLLLYSFPSYAKDAPAPFLEAGEEPVLTDLSYRSENIVIDITSTRACDSDVYIADIHVRSLDCFLRAFARKVAKIHKHCITSVYTEFSHNGFKDAFPLTINPDMKFVTAFYRTGNIKMSCTVTVKNSDVLPVVSVILYFHTHMCSLKKLCFYAES